jgi:hypothetical protein
VVRAWEATAAIAYAIACISMLRSDDRNRWIWDGASFALFTLLEPFGPISGMISLGPAALIAASAYCGQGSREIVARRLFMGACALSFFGAVAQYRPLLRLLLVLGLDFYAALLLFAALASRGSTRGPEISRLGRTSHPAAGA